MPQFGISWKLLNTSHHVYVGLTNISTFGWIVKGLTIPFQIQ